VTGGFFRLFQGRQVVQEVHRIALVLLGQVGIAQRHGHGFVAQKLLNIFQASAP